MPSNSPASTKANLLTVHQTGGGWEHFWRQFAAVELEQPGSGLQEGYHGREGRVKFSVKVQSLSSQKQKQAIHCCR